MNIETLEALVREYRATKNIDFNEFSTERLVRLLFIMSDREDKARVRLRAARVCHNDEAFAEALEDTTRECLAVEFLMQELNRRGVDV